MEIRGGGIGTIGLAPCSCRRDAVGRLRVLGC